MNNLKKLIEKWEKMEGATKIMKDGFFYKDLETQKALDGEMHLISLFLIDLKKLNLPDVINSRLIELGKENELLKMMLASKVADEL
jgi:hypothetical protein